MAYFQGARGMNNSFPIRKTKSTRSRYEKPVGAGPSDRHFEGGVSEWGRQQLGQSARPNAVAWEPQREAGGWKEGRKENEIEPRMYRTSIQGLSPHQPDTCIVGIVITKHSIRAFPDKKNPGCERFRFSFTLRDSPADYINITCWASDFNHMTSLHNTFRICDVVEIMNGQILSKSGGDSEERWSAWTPSPYAINVSENYSKISLYSGPDLTDFSSLAHAPLRPMGECHTLMSLQSQGNSMEGSHVSVLAAVRHVGRPKEMTSKNGKQLTKCEVKLMDRDCPGFNLLIWDQELIELAQTWRPKENIILAVDVKASLDTYRNCMTVICDQKTLIITNPDCKEAHQLFQYTQTVDISEDIVTTEEQTTSDNISVISEVFTIEELQEKQETGSWGAVDTGGGGGGPNHFTGILYACLTQLDIVENSNAVVCYRCSVCNFRVPEGATLCSNQNCPSHQTTGPTSYRTPSGTTTATFSHDKTSEGFHMEPHFNLLVSLSDCTGGVEGVKLMGQPAAELIGITPIEFLKSDDMERVAIKNKLLLERFKVYFKSSSFHGNQKKSIVRILSLSLADMKEVADHM